MKKTISLILCCLLSVVTWAQEDKHQLTVSVTPSYAGTIGETGESTYTYLLSEGESIDIKVVPKRYYEYDYDLFSLVAWTCGGAIVSTSNPLHVVMGNADRTYTATMVYDPQGEVPYDPAANYFNPATGELVMEDFETGKLSDAIDNTFNGSFNSTDIKSMEVVGAINETDIRAIMKYGNSCVALDLSRTTGLTNLGVNLRSNSLGYSIYGFLYPFSNLEQLVLPADLKTIQREALMVEIGSRLKEIICYAPTPPEYERETFIGVPEGVIARVPENSLQLYEQANGWKDLTLLPLTEARNITVMLPADAKDGRYRNFFLEIQNTKSGYKRHYVIGELTGYMFHALPINAAYNIVVKNAFGYELGRIDNVMLDENDLTVAFEQLKQPQTVKVKVTTPEQTDVTAQVKVLWQDDKGNDLGVKSILDGQVEGTSLTCHLTLNEDLTRKYGTPAILSYKVGTEGTYTLECPLQKLQTVMLIGTVTEKATGKPLQDAVVSATQMMGGKYAQSTTATTDAAGHWQMTITNTETKLTASATGYTQQRQTLESLTGNNELPAMELERLTGPIVNVWMTYTPAVGSGEEAQTIEGYNGFNDFDYTIYNLTQGIDVAEPVVQDQRLQMPRDVAPGDSLRITATSRTGQFSPIEAGCRISPLGLAYMRLPVVQQGGIRATITASESKTAMGLLYDDKGKLVASGNYNSEGLTLTDIPKGHYQLITMSRNSYLRYQPLSVLEMMGLKGQFYMVNEVEIKDGYYTNVSIANLPQLNMPEFNLLSNEYINSDKQVVYEGAYFTLKTRVDFNPKYRESIGNVELILHAAGNALLMDNSVVSSTNGTGMEYAVEDGNFVFGISKEGESLACCFIPVSEGDCSCSAAVRFWMGGEQITLPIGTARIISKGTDLSCTTVERTNRSDINVWGETNTSLSDYPVDIYDNGTLIGQTIVGKDGRYTASVNLCNAVSPSFHSIQAKVMSPFGELRSKGIITLYDIDIITPDSLKMLYLGYEGIEEISINNRTGIVQPRSYKHFSDEHTFLAYLSPPDKIMVSNVQFIVYASDHTCRYLDAEYDDTRKCWVATASYPSVYKLPVGVEVIYDVVGSDSGWSGRLDDQIEISLLATQHVEEVVAQRVGETVLCDDEERVDFTLDLGGAAQPRMEWTEMDYEEALAFVKENKPMLFNSEKGHLAMSLENGEDVLTVVAADMDEQTAMRCRISLTDATGKTMGAAGKSARTAPNGPRRLRLSGNSRAKAWKTVANVGDDILSLLDLQKYMDAPNDMADIRNEIYRRELEMERWDRQYDRQLERLCYLNSGTRPMYNEGQKKDYRKKADNLYNQCVDALDRMDRFLSDYEETLMRKGVFDVALLGLGELKLAGKAAAVGGKIVGKSVNIGKSEAAKAVKSWLGLYYDAEVAPSLDEMLSLKFEDIYDEFKDWTKTEFEFLNSLRIALYDDMLENGQCPSDEPPLPPGGPDDPDDPWPGEPPFPFVPIIDPSGYVYEGVPSNRLQGVTATLWYKDIVGNSDGRAGDEREVKWDAEEYGQANPLLTDAEGMYRWDVPQGLWQVRLEKEGYEPTRSEWLPVPPPQLDVNLAMSQNKAPEVEEAHAYEEGVIVKFDKYMQSDLLSAERIAVKVGEESAEGQITLLDEEAAAEGVTYARSLRFVPERPFSARYVTLVVQKEVASYAGLPMQEDYIEVLPVKAELKSLETDSVIKVGYGSFYQLKVKALPAAAVSGKRLTARLSSGMIAGLEATEADFDEEGVATLKVNGLLPGADLLTLSVSDCEKDARVLVNVIKVKERAVAAPLASIESGTEVDWGTEVTLTCETEGATIYYTLDGTCPCVSDSRMVYDGTPIVITEATTLSVMAAREGWGESEVKTYHYTVRPGTGVASLGSTVSVSPTRVSDGFVVDGFDGRAQVTVYNTAGSAVMQKARIKAGQYIDARMLPTGIYVVSIQSGDWKHTQRIIKM